MPSGTLFFFKYVPTEAQHFSSFSFYNCTWFPPIFTRDPYTCKVLRVREICATLGRAGGQRTRLVLTVTEGNVTLWAAASAVAVKTN